MALSSSRKVNLSIILLYSICCIIIAVIIAWTNVKFFEGELKEYDRKIFSKVQELNSNLSDIDSYMKQVEKIIFEGDLAILCDFKNSRVIDSINVVVGEQFEEQVNKAIEFNSERIRLDKDKLEFNKNTYIQNINLKIDDVNYHMLEDGYVLYYIPRWIVRENYLLKRLLQAFSLSCFFSAVTIWLFDQQLRKL
jgi:uncharacterized membrane protein YraQ (UPF0718 family)